MFQKIIKYGFLMAMLLFTAVSCKNEQTKEIRILVTTDVHGALFSKDLLAGLPERYSMSKISGYLKSDDNSSQLILDNGDNLQGNPSVYYYNFEDTTSQHLWARVLNYMGYDANTVGNHDIEAGHSVYDRIRNDYDMPMLAGNAINIVGGGHYFEPYVLLKKGGLKIAVIGLTTPGVPGWLPEILYEGIGFGDMVEYAEIIMDEVIKNKPDLVIGLFHAGWDETYGGDSIGSYLNENASLSVAEKVPGFDIIFIGHDHHNFVKYVKSVGGDSVLILDGGSNARYISEVIVKVSGKGSVREKEMSGSLIDVSSLYADPEYDSTFNSDYSIVSEWVSREIGYLETELTTRDSYFGDSPFMDLIHKVQLETTGADISFAAPLSYDVSIPRGKVTVLNMFDLYRYENMLYTIELSGNEVDGYLEYSANLWFERMNSSNDNLLKYENNTGTGRLKNLYYDFDSAEGINYIIDVSKPEGDRVEITSLNDGRDFEMNAKYKIALNSYRGSGGGDHLVRGAGLDKHEINSRIIRSTDKDLRYYMIKWFETKDTVSIIADNNWKVVPEDWVKSAMRREYGILFK